jgi:hypothetical protein
MSGTRLPRALARVDPTTLPASDAPTTRLIYSRGASLFCLLDAKAMLDRSVQMFNILCGCSFWGRMSGRQGPMALAGRYLGETFSA